MNILLLTYLTIGVSLDNSLWITNYTDKINSSKLNLNHNKETSAPLALLNVKSLNLPTLSMDNKNGDNISNIVFVSNENQFIKEISNIEKSKKIILKNGVYTFNSTKLRTNKIKNTHSKVIITAQNDGYVDFKLNTIEGILIDTPNWQINGINFKGICPDDKKCEHGLHIVGDAKNIVISNNTFIDFNAAIKVNKKDNLYPDDGIIEYNRFHFTKPRNTATPVTPINIDHANRWLVRKNIISDFSKANGNKVSYAAFMKGGISDGIFEQNLVICSSDGKNLGTRVGLSLGGGGMSKTARRNQAEYETRNSVIRNNIIMNCNDVGVYIQKSLSAEVYNNTIYNTKGIDVRYSNSTALIINNILNGKIRSRDKAKVYKENNLTISKSYSLKKPTFNSIYKSPKDGDFSIISSDHINHYISGYVKVSDGNTDDFCNNKVNDTPYIGAVLMSTNCFN
ncbi:NosD domain-containing protein [Photobacterium sanctipauli]|nr:hypothetical protein [Photobacterium sanctipauli]